MVKKKSKSKRLTIKQRSKIERKVREHHRELRKEARNAIRNGTKQVKKDPGIPNLWPYKEQILKEIQQAKEMEEERKQLQREQNIKVASDLRKTSLEQLSQRAEQLQNNFNSNLNKDGETLSHSKEHFAGKTNRKAYFAQLKKVIDTSDIVLEVLDARDPIGCRSKYMECKILEGDPNKKIILVLNKIDLIPRDIVLKWLTVLRKDFPTIAFRASQQEVYRLSNKKGNNLSQLKKKAESLPLNSINSSKTLGSDTLLQLLKNYSRSDGMKTSITVGVIGFPNTGKSSIINSMCRHVTVGVSSTPGYTKEIKEVYLDKKVKILDCPGIIYNDDENDANILRNCISLNAIDDPESVIDKILGKLNTEFLMKHYSIPMFRNCDEFLYIIAKKRGKIHKGGIPDKKAAAKSVLMDWNRGTIPFYISPPIEESKLSEVTIVNDYADDTEIANFAGGDSVNYMIIQDTEPNDNGLEVEDE